MVDNYKGYLELLSKNYNEAVVFLLQKYGPTQDDYFREKSYQRFIKGEIKSISGGKISRTNEGLYCHHISENKWSNMSDKSFIREYKIPFEFQKKDRLVYCDLIEHSILHVLITKETAFKFGYAGYLSYLRGLIEAWYLDETMPNQEWMKKCYNNSFLNPQEAFEILKEMQSGIGKSYFSTLFDYYEEIRKEEEEREKWLQNRKEIRIAERENWIERAKKLHSKSPRSEIVTASYFICIKHENETDVFNNNYIAHEEYISKMKKFTKEKILEELLIYIEELSEIPGEEIH